MENASRALLLAAGILIGIVLLSLTVFLYNALRDANAAKYLNVSEEQILKYNAEFESFNKQRMYGTDVITAMNKAIDLNTQNEWYSAKDYQIDIIFSLENTVKNYVVPYNMNSHGQMEMGSQSTTSRYINIKSTSYSLEKGKTYSLYKHYTSNNDSGTINKFLKTQTEDSDYKVKKSIQKDKYGNENYYEMYYSGFSDFKRKIFKCDNVEYDTNNGKISKMYFVEIIPKS